MMPIATKWWALKDRVSKQELRTWKVQKQVRLSFFFLRIRRGGVGKPFKPKTRNFHLNLNSQRVFKNDQYFMFQNLILEYFFKTSFSYAV